METKTKYGNTASWITSIFIYLFSRLFMPFLIIRCMHASVWKQAIYILYRERENHLYIIIVVVIIGLIAITLTITLFIFTIIIFIILLILWDFNPFRFWCLFKVRETNSLQSWKVINYVCAQQDNFAIFVVL